MDNLVECAKCEKVMMDEEYNAHTCLPKVKNWKTVKIAHFYINEDDLGRKHLNILGWDGIDYEFIEEVKNKELTKIPYHPKLNKENFNDKHPDSEQILISRSAKMSEVDLMKFMVLSFGGCFLF